MAKPSKNQRKRLKELKAEENNSNQTAAKTDKQTFFYKYVPIETAELIIDNMSLKFTNPLEFNDPFDCNFPGYNPNIDIETLLFPLIDKFIPQEMLSFLNGNSSLNDFIKNELNIPKEFEVLKIEIVSFLEELRTEWDKYISEFRILSLTTKEDNILMWSHYANFHKGAVLCFDFSNDPIFQKTQKVKYDSENKLLNSFIDKLLISVIQFITKSDNNIDTALKKTEMVFQQDNFLNRISFVFLTKMISFFYIKKNEWHYEEEHRIVLNKNKLESDFVNFKPESLRKVIFGVQCDKKIKKNIELKLSKQLPNTQKLHAYKENGILQIR